jgi:hypothetical protein
MMVIIIAEVLLTNFFDERLFDFFYSNWSPKADSSEILFVAQLMGVANTLTKRLN